MRLLKSPLSIFLILSLPLAACAAPYQGNGDTTLREIQDLYAPSSSQSYERQAPSSSTRRYESSELNSYQGSSYLSYPEESDPEWHGSIAFPFGIQTVDDFGDIDELASIGLFDLAIQPPGSPLSLVVQVLGGFNSDVPQEDLSSPFGEADSTFVSQFNLGLRYVWRDGPVQPYIGGGGSLIDSNIIEDRNGFGNDDLDSDTDFAGWAGAGVNFLSPGGFLVGINLQYLFGAEAELLGTTYDLDGLTASFVIGYGF